MVHVPTAQDKQDVVPLPLDTPERKEYSALGRHYLTRRRHMEVSVGTFNLNNLFSRFNFQAEVGDDAPDLQVTVNYSFADPATYKVRTFQGRVVRAKSGEERRTLAQRIREMNVDVLAVQEVEDITTLRLFATEDLAGMYRYTVLVEGNDPRLIDLGLLSKLPIGGITSWQHVVHPEEPGRPVFSRDLLEVEMLNHARTRRLFTLYNNHLKSHYVPYDEDPDEGAYRANTRRRRQAETVARVVASRMRPSSPYIVLGDMNDSPHSPYLAPLVHAPGLGLVNALANPTETRPAKPDDPPPSNPSWTHRYRARGEPPRYDLFDQIWLSPSLARRQTGAWIHRRRTHSGDGSDHDPAWVGLEL